MMSLRDRLICCLLAASFPGHSLLAMGMLPRPLAMPAATVVAIAPAPSAAPAAPPAGGWMPSTLCPFTIVPLASVSPAFIEQQRAAITSQLVGLGYDLGAADGMASELTAEDLAVLLANPKMMQKAGDVVIIILAVVLVCGIVALALAADSAVIITN